MDINDYKTQFISKLKYFTQTLESFVTTENHEWSVKGFIDTHKNIYTVSNDTKIISKVLELHLFPLFLKFADENGYDIVLAECQNWYPDLSFVLRSNSKIKFAVDLKTTYRLDNNPEFCNGFTLGSHGAYFIDRESKKNIQFPYNEYLGHFCLGIIYKRVFLDKSEETKKYSIEQLDNIPSVAKDFLFFIAEKWKIASDKSGSGNTANIGSIKSISNLLSENGVFIKAGEAIFNAYWMNYGKISITKKDGSVKKLTSLSEYLSFCHLSKDLLNSTKQQ